MQTGLQLDGNLSGSQRNMITAPVNSDLTRHSLSPDDAIRGSSLSAEIGWNQTRDDWKYMLENGFGDGCSDSEGKLVASGMALPYGAFGWVCMVLVSEPWRRRGLATSLMNGVISQLEELGITPGLDATPAGREVYLPLGFRETIGIARLVTERAEIPAINLPVSAMELDDLEEIGAYDREVFGADRSALLRHLLDRQPSRAVLARHGGQTDRLCSGPRRSPLDTDRTRRCRQHFDCPCAGGQRSFRGWRCTVA